MSLQTYETTSKLDLHIAAILLCGIAGVYLISENMFYTHTVPVKMVSNPDRLR